MSARIAELEEEVRQLRALLHMDPELAVIHAFRSVFSLKPSEARILACLYDAGSSWMNTERLNMALPLADVVAGRDDTCIRVHLCRIRKAIGRDSILTSYGRGYTLSAQGVIACDEALARLAERAA